MAHFAKLDAKNEVIFVTVGRDQDIESELTLRTGDVYKQTSYNTRGGVHLLGGTPLRKNFAGLGYTYDAIRDAFIPPKPYSSWVLDEDTCLWNSPVPYPKDLRTHSWDEQTQQWVAIVLEGQTPVQSAT
jgi:hypothetical protein